MLRYEQSLSQHLSTLNGTMAAPPGGLQAGTSEEWGIPATDPATPHTLDIGRLSAATQRFRTAAASAKRDAQALAAGMTWCAVWCVCVCVRVSVSMSVSVCGLLVLVVLVLMWVWWSWGTMLGVFCGPTQP